MPSKKKTSSKRAPAKKKAAARKKPEIQETAGLEIHWRDPRDLKDADYNPRQLTQEQAEHIRASIRKFGLVEPLIVNRHPDRMDVLVGGHQRKRIAIDLGETEVPVVYCDLDEAAERELNVRLNKNTGDWDWDALANNFEPTNLLDWGFSEADLDFDEGPPNQRNADPTTPTESEAEALRKKWGVKPGQLWKIGGHRILCGDSTSPEDWDRLMHGEKAVLCHTDPPYGVDYKNSKGQGLEGDAQRDDDLLAKLLVPALRLAMENTRDDAAFYVWHASSTRRDFQQALDTVGLHERQYITWCKDNIVLGHVDYHGQTEPAFYCHKAGKPCRWLGDRKQSTVWQIRPPAPAHLAASIANGIRLSDGEGNQVYVCQSAPKNKKTRLVRLQEGESLEVITEYSSDAWMFKRDSRKDLLHPTQKPVDLFMVPIRNHTEAGDIIVEPFSGGAGQMVAAQRSGRRCYAMELDPAFVAVALERMHKEGLEPEKAE